MLGIQKPSPLRALRAQKESDQSNRDSKSKAVQLGKVGRIEGYQRAVMAEWPGKGSCAKG